MPLITKYVRKMETLVGQLERDCRHLPDDKLDALITESVDALKQKKTLTAPWLWAAYVVNDWATFEQGLRTFKKPKSRKRK